jgi:hypothetical protein
VERCSTVGWLSILVVLRKYAPAKLPVRPHHQETRSRMILDKGGQSGVSETPYLFGNAAAASITREGKGERVGSISPRFILSSCSKVHCDL